MATVASLYSLHYIRVLRETRHGNSCENPYHHVFADIRAKWMLGQRQEPRGNNPMKEEQTNVKVATLAGGCFWCLAADFENVFGVTKVISGYTGGQKENPTYEEVSTGKTGHHEAIQVYYDPSNVSYERLLDIFWRHIDPTDAGGQFADRGPQYRTVIFYHDEEQKRIAEKSKEDLEKSGQFKKPIVTSIVK